jgi:hypothetical protein
MNFAGLFAVDVIEGLIDEYGEAVEKEGPWGCGGVKGGEAGEDESADDVCEEADEGDGIGCPVCGDDE